MTDPMTLTDHERRNVKGQDFLADLHNYIRTVWSRMILFGMVVHVGEKHISKQKLKRLYTRTYKLEVHHIVRISST